MACVEFGLRGHEDGARRIFARARYLVERRAVELDLCELRRCGCLRYEDLAFDSGKRGVGGDCCACIP